MNAPDRRTVRTMCPMNCHPTLCGMVATVERGSLVDIAGDPTHPDSAGFLCMRGEAAHEIVGNPGRLTTPLMRDTRDGPFRPATWDAALDRIVAAVGEAGAAATALWPGHGMAVNDYGVGVKGQQIERFANAAGFQWWNPAMICWGLGGFGFGLTGAAATSLKEDMSANAATIVLWGANTPSQSNTTRHLVAARKRGARIAVIDVRRTEAAALADMALTIRPGTDAALALAVAHVLIAEGLCDADFIARRTVGFAEFSAHVAKFSPERAAAETGIPAARIIELARMAADGPTTIVAGGSSMHKGANGWNAARAIACLPALTGDYGRPGGGLGPRHGAHSDGRTLNRIAGESRLPAEARIPAQMDEITAALADGRIRVLMCLGANMASAFPDANRLSTALARTDLVVSYDIFMNETARRHADIVLPSTIWLEEIGCKATGGHLHLCEQALPPAGEARPIYQILPDLGARTGLENVFPWPDQEAAINAVIDHPSTGGATVAGLRAAGGRLPLDVAASAYADAAFATPSGKIEFHSAQAEALGLPPLPTPEPAPQAPAAWPLRLATGRTWTHFHSFYDQGRALPTLAARDPAPRLWLSPEDATARGVADGDPIVIRSARGEFDAHALVTDRMPAGAVWMRDGWYGLNALTDSAPVLPEAALDLYPFTVGQSSYAATVEVAARPG